MHQETTLLELKRDANGRVCGVVRCPLKNIIGCPHDIFRKRLSDKLVGSYDLDNIDYTVVGHDCDDIMVMVSGSISDAGWEKVLGRQEALAWRELYGKK